MNGRFSTHIKNTISKASKRNNILKALSSTSWGQQKETLIMTYKAICRPVLEYAAPVWETRITPSQRKQIQISQNNALRTSTGCHLMTPIKHLHHESKILTIEQHTSLLAKQYLLQCHIPHHPRNYIIRENTAPCRNLRPTLHNTHIQYIDNLRIDGPPTFTPNEYKFLLKTMHTDTVTDSIATNSFNTVLQANAPPIHKSELTLTRKARTTLAQLRSGYSTYLNSYMARIDSSTLDICPHCTSHPHSTHHLFTCPATPTHLTVNSLWQDPVGSATFLSL
jgi:hypothetical protein